MRRLALLLAATLLPPLAAGGAGLALRAGGGRVDAAPAADLALPAARPPAGVRPLAVIVAGDHGTEITDALPIVELLAASEAFEVRVVAPARRPAPFVTSLLLDAGLDFVPDLGFDEYPRLVGRAPDLLVVPYLPRWRREDAAVVPWLTAHAGPATTVLAICQGAELAAAAGLLDGHQATANASMLDSLAARHPAVRWQRRVRWVRDGNRVSSSLLAGGLDATLAAIDGLAGRAAAARAAAAAGIRLDLEDRALPAASIPLAAALAAAYGWERSRVAVAIGDGVSEAALAGLVDAHGSTLDAETVTVAAAGRVVRSRHGLTLLARATSGAGRPVGIGYGSGIADLARERGPAVARMTARLLNVRDIPAGPELALGVAVRPLLVALGGLLFAAARTRRAAQRRCGGGGGGGGGGAGITQTISSVLSARTRPVTLPSAPKSRSTSTSMGPLRSSA